MRLKRRGTILLLRWTGIVLLALVLAAFWFREELRDCVVDDTRFAPEIAAAAPKHTVLEKNSTNGFLEPVFELWRREHATATTYLVTGDCTDICVLQFVLSAKAWHNTRNLPLRILVPTALTDTFDAPGHPADTLGAAALYLMEAAGAELYGDVV